MRTFPRRHLRDLAATALLTSTVSLFPFAVVYREENAFQPIVLRTLFLTFLVVSWPFSVSSAVLAVIVLTQLDKQAPEERYLHRKDSHKVAASLVASFFALVGNCFVVAAQLLWVYVASRVGIVWLLCLVVLGLAMLLVITTSSCTIFVSAMRVRLESDSERQGLPEVSVLQIDPDNSSPQSIMRIVSKQNSDLVF